MNKDYSMYRYYKGEQKNPFDSKKQNNAHMFWFYESVFDRDFIEKESSDWYAFFGSKESYLGRKFMDLLSVDDYTRPDEKKKKEVFRLWLTYLFTEKLYPEYGDDNYYLEAYLTAAAQ